MNHNQLVLDNGGYRLAPNPFIKSFVAKSIKKIFYELLLCRICGNKTYKALQVVALRNEEKVQK